MKFVVNNVADVTFKRKDTNEVLFKGKTIVPIKDHNIKIDTYSKGDVLKVVSGKYKDIEGSFIDYVDGYDKILIQTDEMNRLYINSKDIELIRKKVNNTHKTETKNMTYNGLNIIVSFEGSKTIVFVPTFNTYGKVVCDEMDEFDEQLAINLAYLKAEKEYYKRRIKDCNNRINSIIDDYTN